MTRDSLTTDVSLALALARQLTAHALLLRAFLDRQPDFQAQLDWVWSAPPGYQKRARTLLAEDLHAEFPLPGTPLAFWSEVIVQLMIVQLNTGVPDDQRATGDTPEHGAPEAAADVPEHSDPHTGVPSGWRQIDADLPAVPGPPSTSGPDRRADETFGMQAGEENEDAADQDAPRATGEHLLGENGQGVSAEPATAEPATAEPTAPPDLEQSAPATTTSPESTLDPAPSTDPAWRAQALTVSAQLARVRASSPLSDKKFADLLGTHGVNISIHAMNKLSTVKTMKSIRRLPISDQDLARLPGILSTIRAGTKAPRSTATAPTAAPATHPAVTSPPAKPDTHPGSKATPSSKDAWREPYVLLKTRLQDYRHRHALTWAHLHRELRNIGTVLPDVYLLQLMGSDSVVRRSPTRPYPQGRHDEVLSGLQRLEAAETGAALAGSTGTAS